jgi:hypothetical protein
MIIAVEGTKTFSDYETFMRAMGVALSQAPDGAPIEVWSAGPHKINNFTASFCNSTENYLKSKGHRVTFRMYPPKTIENRLQTVDYLAYFSQKREPVSRLVAAAELLDREVGIFRV